jgi:fructuronate reductase
VTAQALSRTKPAPPVRVIHLGLGNFFRAHQAWYTDRSPDGADWGIAAFTGRRAALADALIPQDGLYTLITRGAEGERFDVISSLSCAHPATDHDAWLAYAVSPETRIVTITVTEAGYLRGAGGGLDLAQPSVRADVETLKGDRAALVSTAPARLVAGLWARHRADAGPITLLPCDNLPENGAVVARVVRDLAELLDPALAAWIEESVSTVTTVVDRITPRSTSEDVELVADQTGLADRAPVVTEPFSEWVLSGAFPGGRPRWEDAGATFSDDATPYEQRKLWLLNGGHSLLAYAGSALGHQSVSEAVADDRCRAWLEEWWSEAAAHLSLPASEVTAYRSALLERFANPHIRHRLDQIAADGSQKLPVRILPVLRLERSAGRLPEGAVRVVAAWVAHLRGAGAPVQDPKAEDLTAAAAYPLADATRRILDMLDPAVGGDAEVVAAVASEAEVVRSQSR